MVDTALRSAPKERGVVDGAGVRADVRRRLRLSPQAAWALGCLGVDAGMLALAVLATSVGAAAGGFASAPTSWTLLFALFTVVLFQRRRLYRLRFQLGALDDVRAVIVSTTIAAMGVLSLRLLLGDAPDLAAESLRPWAFAAVYLSAGRVAFYWTQTKARQEGESARPTLIVGAGRIGYLTARRLLARPELGLKPVAFLDKEPLEDTRALGLPVAGASWDLDEVVSRYGVQQVIVTFSTAPDEVLLRLVRRCEELHIPVSVVPRLFERVPEKHTVEHLGGLPLVTAHPADPKSVQFAIKYSLDRILAALLVLLAGPVSLPAASRATTGAPASARSCGGRRSTSCRSSSTCSVAT